LYRTNRPGRNPAAGKGRYPSANAIGLDRDRSFVDARSGTGEKGSRGALPLVPRRVLVEPLLDPRSIDLCEVQVVDTPVSDDLGAGRFVEDVQDADLSGPTRGAAESCISSLILASVIAKQQTSMYRPGSEANLAPAVVAFSSLLLPNDHEKRFVRCGSNPVRERRDRTNEFITDSSRSSIPDDCMNRFLTIAGRFLARFQNRYAASSHITVSGPDPVFLGAALATEARTRSVSG
jgi:hypothetical protein